MKKLLFLTSIICTVMSCSSSKLTAGNPLFQHKWVLSELNGTPVQMSNTDKDANLNFAFEGMKVYGSGGCNRLTGIFNAKGDDLSFGPMASTRMMCPDSQFESSFLAAIGKVNHYHVENNMLELSQDKTILAKLIAQ